MPMGFDSLTFRLSYTTFGGPQQDIPGPSHRLGVARQGSLRDRLLFLLGKGDLHAGRLAFAGLFLGPTAFCHSALIIPTKNIRSIGDKALDAIFIMGIINDRG